MRVHVVAATGAGQTGQDRRRSATARIAHEKTVLAIEDDALHLPFRDVVVDGHRAIGAEDVQLRPLAQGVVDRLGNGMLGQQLLLPLEKLLAQLRQHRRRLLLAQPQALRHGSIPGLLLDRTQRTHHLDRFPHDLVAGHHAVVAAGAARSATSPHQTDCVAREISNPCR